jgi:hypothetical protein
MASCFIADEELLLDPSQTPPIIMTTLETLAGQHWTLWQVNIRCHLKICHIQKSFFGMELIGEPPPCSHYSHGRLRFSQIQSELVDTIR